MPALEEGDPFSLYFDLVGSHLECLDPGLGRLVPFSSLAVFKGHTMHARSTCTLLIDEVRHLNIIQLDIKKL